MTVPREGVDLGGTDPGERTSLAWPIQTYHRKDVMGALLSFEFERRRRESHGMKQGNKT